MDVFTAIAEPTRREILTMLASNGKMPATSIYRRFKSSPPAISQHLKVLREADLVRVDKLAQQRLYYMNPTKLSELERWVRQFTAVKEAEFRRLDSLLESMKEPASSMPMLPFE
ncbi:MAG: helix-turn-helix transcriptional regulator [Acidobacteria bacterium]|nr:helix-turn-helix transcriptional regulator [Acidobacteriota bacterium]MCW5949336.1 helix-turn-helix transcriptional regulator [Pyrinomonadaceae bacterium]